MKRFRNMLSLFLSIFVVLLLMAGCSSSTDPETDNGGEEDYKNPNLPNANHLIINTQVYGDSEKESSIWDMDGNQTYGFHFIGIDDYVVSSGFLTGSGPPAWQQPVDYDPRYTLAVQSDRFNGAIAVGAKDSDNDGYKDQGIATLITPDGTIQHQLAVTDASACVWFNGVTFFADSIFLCVGACNLLDSNYPFLSILFLTSDGTLRAGSKAILDNLPLTLFLDIVPGVVLQENPAGRVFLDCYIDGNKSVDEATNITLHNIRCPVDSLSNTEIFWSRDIVAYPGLDTQIYTGKSLTLGRNGNLYIAGRTDVNKDPSPSGGGYWGGGLIASVSTAGEINWINPIVLSQYRENYYCVYATDQELYAAGRYSSFLHTSTDQLFGYGLLSKFDLTSGDVEYHHSFGSELYSSFFNTLYVEGLTAYAAGKTKHYTNSGGYQAMFATIDASTPAPIIIFSEKNTIEATVSDDPCRGIGNHGGGDTDIR